MTMDLLYNQVRIPTQRRRVHFHEFMLEIHDKIHRLKLEKAVDPIRIIAQDIAREAWFLCLDELQVTDISDAMLLRQLFTELLNNNCVVVTTSNRHPDELYKNGIQRSSFLSTIDLLKERLVVHSLDSGTDYRRSARDSLQVYFHPLNDSNLEMINDVWNALVEKGGLPVNEKKIEFYGRHLVVPQTSGRLARMSFDELCRKSHSSVDYLELVKHFDGSCMP